MMLCGCSCVLISRKAKSSSWPPPSACSTTSTASTMPCAWNRPNNLPDILRRLVFLSLFSAAAAAACIPVADAPKKIGAIACVSGKVVKITAGPGGVQYIDFCAEHARCVFSAVVFADHLRDVGDIRTLAGKTLEVHGQVRAYDG